MDDRVESGEILPQFFGKALNAFRCFNVENGGFHTRVGGRGLVQHVLPPARDDDLIAFAVEDFGKRAANTRAATGDQNGISCNLQ